MRVTLREVAELVNGTIIGDPETVITGVCGIKEAKVGDLTFLADSRYLSKAQATKASAVIVSRETIGLLKPQAKVDNPSLAFAKAVALITGIKPNHPQGIHPSAIVSPNAKIEANVAIGAYSIVEDGVKIACGSIIYPGCYIGIDTTIGKKCLIYPNVSIRERISIGSNVIIHSNTVIGSDGFGFAEVEGMQEKIPQVGTVVIEDDVEIGACVAIDRARFDKTIIGKGTKIDNLVQIAHNVIVGKNCIIVAQVGIAGSVVLGEKVILAGQSGVVGHMTVGDGCVIAAKSGVTKNLAPNTTVSGFPARPHDVMQKVNACIQRLPDIYQKVTELEKNIQTLLPKKKKNGKTKVSKK